MTYIILIVAAPLISTCIHMKSKRFARLKDAGFRYQTTATREGARGETSLHAAEGVYRANTSGQLDASGGRARVHVPLFVRLNKILLYEQAARTRETQDSVEKDRRGDVGRAKEESYDRSSARCIETVWCSFKELSTAFSDPLFTDTLYLMRK